MLDTLTCAAPHAIALPLPCAPGTVIDRVAGGALLARDGVALRVAGDETLAWHVEDRHVSPAYGVEVPAPALVATATITAPTTVCTVLAATDECDVTAVRRIGARRWEIAHRAGTDVVAAPHGSAVDIDGLSFDGTLLVVAEADGATRAHAAGRGTLVAEGLRHAVDRDGTVVLERAAGRWRVVEG